MLILTAAASACGVAVIVYPMSGLVNGVQSEEFGYLYLMIFLLNSVAKTWCLFMACACPNQQVRFHCERVVPLWCAHPVFVIQIAQAITPITMLLFSVFSGYNGAEIFDSGRYSMLCGLVKCRCTDLPYDLCVLCLAQVGSGCTTSRTSQYVQTHAISCLLTLLTFRFTECVCVQYAIRGLCQNEMLQLTFVCEPNVRTQNQPLPCA